jgi:RNA processing factor Prp31
MESNIEVIGKKKGIFHSIQHAKGDKHGSHDISIIEKSKNYLRKRIAFSMSCW